MLQSIYKPKKYFRKMFCLSHKEFKNIVIDLKRDVLFSLWNNSDAVGDPLVPIELLLLVFLQMVGRGFTLDNLEECTAISAETHWQFISKFIQYGSSILWKQYVSKVDTDTNAEYNTSLFQTAGIPGCIGSVDVTHALRKNCADWAQNRHKGYKLNKPSRNYNVTCNHMRELLACTQGFPAM